MLKFSRLLSGVVAAAALLAATSALAQRKEIVIGLQCDRTGPTQTVGVFLCPGYHDYIALVNSKGGINGTPVRAIEIDTEYKVPASVERSEERRVGKEC